MLGLLTKFQVFPAFINVLRAFGQRTGVVDESYSGFYFQQAGEPNANGRSHLYLLNDKDIDLIF